MSKDGLKKIYLIKSAGYEFVEIDIADNTLLLGESGVGKTTLMRAVLFFYTMDYSDTMLNLTSETKKSSDYFKELKEFVNRSGFVFLNGMPIEDDMLISMYPTIYVGQNYGSYSKMILASKMEV